MLLCTFKGLHLDQLANVASTVIPFDPDDESIQRAPCHFVEKLQALLLPLWVKNPRFQQGCLFCHPRACIEVHEVASICGESTQHPICGCPNPRIPSSQGEVK